MLIVVGGMIGLGKSSVAEVLGEALGSNVFYESVDDNPILPLFYTASPEEIQAKRYPFLLQLYFLDTRFKAIKQANFIKDISESEFLNKINEVDFLFIDDLGKEFLAREVGQNSAKWLEEKVFDVINKRYNSKLPIIFSGNYSIQELGTVLDLDRSILERINEISARCLYLTGQNFRKNLQQSNSELLKKLGI